MIRFPGRLLVLLASLGLLAPTRSADPRVTLRLGRATAGEAAMALTRATGVAVEVIPWPRSDVPGAVLPPLEDLERPSRFEWNNASLAQALRDLGRRYQLQPYPRPGGGYLLRQTSVGPAREYGPLAQTNTRGMRIQVRSLSVSGSQPGEAPGERLVLQLHGLTLTGDARAVVGVEDLVARDDQGGVLVSEYSSSARVDHGYPDEWSTRLQLTGLQPGAKQLEFLEGTLMAAPLIRTAHLELPLSLPFDSTRQRLGGRTLEFRALRLPTPLLFAHPTEREGAGPLLLMRVTQAEAEEGVISTERLGSIPVLVGTSGKTYAPSSVGRQGRQVNGLWTYDFTLRYPAADEPLTGIRVNQVERREPRPFGTFRIQKIPLPTAKPAQPGKLYYGALQSRPLTPSGLDYARAGGTLVSPVQLGGRLAPSGRLSVGLSAVDGSTRTRWYEVEVNAQGVGTLPNVKPGAYRVLRLYQAHRSEPVDAPGWWRNDEVTLRVEPGKEARLPPLQLMPGLPSPPPLRLPARLEDLEVSVDRARLGYARILELFTRPEARYDGMLTLDLSGVVGGVETSRFLGLANVVARDDRGSLLTQRSRGTLQPSASGIQGLKWTQSVSLNPPHPEARTLAWLEGELLAFGRVEKSDTDVPLPLPAGGVRKESGVLRIEVDSLDELQPETPPGQPVPPHQYRLRGRVIGPAGTELTDPQGGRWQPLLVGRSGAIYHPARAYDSVGSGRWEFRCRYEVREPVERISFKITARTDLEPIASFRLLRVRLPEPRPFLPPKASLQAVRKRHRIIAGEVRLAAFQQEGGADLVLPVRLGDRPATEGTLRVGVSAQTPQGWGPVRWTEVEVADGEVRLRDLKPGTYRVLRAYQAPEPAGQPSGGRWTGGELQVTLRTGQETTVQPLLWKRGN